MEKSRDLREQEARQIYETYQERLKVSYEQLQVRTLPEHLAQRHSKEYGPESRNYLHYQKDENLNEVYVFVGEKEAYYFGTDKATVPGHIANENLKDGKIVPSEELKEKIRKYADTIYAGSPEQAKKFEEEFFHGQAQDLEVLERIAEKPENLKQIVEKECDKFNRNNGIPEEESERLKQTGSLLEEKEGQVAVGQEENQKEGKTKIPQDVQKACKRMGVNQIRGFFYVNANELQSKVDATRANKNGNKVLIIEVYDNKLGCNKYYGFQEDRMILYGNDSEMNQAVKDVTGNVTQMGKLVRPLKSQEVQYIEYEDSQGLVIREKIEDNQEMSMQEVNRYREDMEDTLTTYSEQIFQIKNDFLLTSEQKIERIQAIDDWCDKTTTKITRENDIDFSLDDKIDEITDERTLEAQNEIADKAKQEDEVDETGKPMVPGARTH